MRRCRFSKLRVSGSLKECERDMGGGGAAAGGGVAMLPLLFKAARCERTLQTTHKKRRTQCRSMGQSACRGPTGRGILGNFCGFGD